jgi:hypothetical protein
MKTGKFIWGLIFVFIGSALLLSNLGLIDFYWGSLWHFWPLILILIGINVLFSRSNPVVGTVLAIVVVAIALVCIGYKSAYLSENFTFPLDDKAEKLIDEGLNDVFSEPYVANTSKAELNINGGAASYHLADTTNNLFDADIKQHYGNYILEKTNRDSTEILNFRMGNNRGKWDIDRTNEANLRLNSNPVWDINVEVGAGKTNFDLRKFKVGNLTLKGGAVAFNIKLGSAQPTSIINVEAGVASVDIQIPVLSACRIHLDSGLSSKTFTGFTKQEDGTYVSDHYSAQAPQKIDINLKGGLSKFEVSRY